MIEIQNSSSLAGSLTIGGAMDGKITIDADMQAGAAISIGGDVSDDITVGRGMDGAISIGAALTGSAQVLIGDACDGPITIGKDTATLSLIRMTGGLGAGGSVTVNDGAGDFDADGTIHVGPLGASALPITFDGSILIKKDPAGPGGGDLNGRIKVVGCHATSDDLDICICGTNNGLVSIRQSTCANQVGWSCVSGCP